MMLYGIPPYSYDGHGINDIHGERLFTCQRHHKDNGGGYVLNNKERARIGHLLAAAPELLEALKNFVDPTRQHYGRLDIALEAIAKAEGRAA